MVGERLIYGIRPRFPLSRGLEVVRAGAASNAAELARVLKIGGLHHAPTFYARSMSNTQIHQRLLFMVIDHSDHSDHRERSQDSS